MQFQEIIKEIEYIEDNYPINEWKIKGIHIWPLIRINLRNQLLYKFNQNTYNVGVINKSNSSSIFSYASTVIKSIYFTFQAILFDIKKNDKISGKYDVLLHTVIQDRVLIDGNYYNRFCDPIAELIIEKGLRAFVIESSPLPIKLKFPRFGKSKYIQHFLTLARVSSFIKIHIFNRNEFDVILEQYDDLSKYLLNKYSVTIWDRTKIKEQIDLLFALKRYYKGIIHKTKIRLGIITMYYSIDGMAFILACKESGVVSCDLQHGVQGDYHVSYGLWNKVPIGGYEVLPRYFLCWSDYEAEAIRKWNNEVQSHHAPMIIGNLFLNKWKNINDPYGLRYDIIINDLKEEIPNKTHILYTLQDYTIPDWVLKTILKSSDSCYWWIRMHPELLQYSTITTRLLNEAGIENYNLYNASMLPLYAIFRNIDIHVTGWSTSVLEACEFGIPSIIIDRLGEEMYSKEVINGFAIIAYDIDHLTNGINQMIVKKIQNPKENQTVSYADFYATLNLILE